MIRWIKPQRRLAVYLRDGLACVWCGDTIEDGAHLSIDHVTPRSHGGGDRYKNLITACYDCNTRRNDKRIETFAAVVAGWLGGEATIEQILSRVEEHRLRPAPHNEALALLRRRSFVDIINSGG